MMSYTSYSIEWHEDPAGIQRKRPTRTTGPCIVADNGSVCFSYSIYSMYCRDRGPSVIYPDGKVVYTNASGWYHRTDGPAVIHNNGYKLYFVLGNELTPAQFFLQYGVL